MATFSEVVAKERDEINRRRRRLGHTDVAPDTGGGATDLVGLALSGGGIRSAAFSLGVLQSLHQFGVIERIDYLSTVSGGGYTGSSLTGTLTAGKGRFSFGDRSSTFGPQTAEISDTPSVSHIRNYSNYLIPYGARDVLTAIAIVVRGLVANVSLTLPFIVLAAAVTILLKPTRGALGRTFSWLEPVMPVQHFGITLVVVVAGVVGFFIWALIRSARSGDNLEEFRGRAPGFWSSYLVGAAIVFFCELQPYLLMGMFDAGDTSIGAQGTNAFGAFVVQTLKRLGVLLAPIAAGVTFFRDRLGSVLKQRGSSSFTRLAQVVLAKAAIWLAAVALPLLIWITYLHLSYWGIGGHPTCGANAHCTDGSESTPRVCCNEDQSRCHQPIDDGDHVCAEAPTDGAMRHTPTWLAGAVGLVPDVSIPAFGRVAPAALLYLAYGAVLMAFSWGLKPNANSLHRLYRDRLSKAFLFDPTKHTSAPTRIDMGRDFEPLDLKLSDIDTGTAPYHLINAALNVPGSDFANRRGRNAEFFFFSKLFVGSNITGYAETTALEAKEPGLDLGTAMAISGAAASSYMGAASIKPLAPTLALLNVRLGYWLANPMYLDPAVTKKAPWSDFYLWAEITGHLYEDSRSIYVTDGGHIDNLGVYELLRRRCGLIIVVDGEADPDMHFPSFVELQRYARIDLGVRIELAWEPIRTSTLKWMASQGETDAELAPACGPHVAIGHIDYGSGKKGDIVYVKASLSGDENDYVRDYARRQPSFPHETTSDQFFNEEQFEVYRALGFHAMFGLLKGSDDVVAPGKTQGLSRSAKVDDPLVQSVRRTLQV